jgi:uncharacterized membrane protein (UPF0127 family)
MKINNGSIFSFFISSITLFLTVLNSYSEAREISLVVKQIAFNQDHPAISFDVEHAVTPEQISWGLMKRDFLPANRGMLFHFPSSRQISMWMFNTYVDLSVAMINENGIITEIQDMKAYPEYMDPQRPINNLADIERYSEYDPIKNFFRRQSIKSKEPIRYALEMNKGWFQKHSIQPGDVVIWESSSWKGWVIPSKDLSLFPATSQPLMVTLNNPALQSVTLANDYQGRDVAFLDSNYQILDMATLAGGKKYPSFKNVFYSHKPVSHIIISEPGWFTRNQIRKNDRIIPK